MDKFTNKEIDDLHLPPKVEKVIEETKEVKKELKETKKEAKELEVKNHELKELLIQILEEKAKEPQKRNLGTVIAVIDIILSILCWAYCFSIMLNR
jgi:hypothetical protein